MLSRVVRLSILTAVMIVGCTLFSAEASAQIPAGCTATLSGPTGHGTYVSASSSLNCNYNRGYLYVYVRLRRDVNTGVGSSNNCNNCRSISTGTSITNYVGTQRYCAYGSFKVDSSGYFRPSACISY